MSCFGGSTACFEGSISCFDKLDRLLLEFDVLLQKFDVPPLRLDILLWRLDADTLGINYLLLKSSFLFLCWMSRMPFVDAELNIFTDAVLLFFRDSKEGFHADAKWPLSGRHSHRLCIAYSGGEPKHINPQESCGKR